MDPGTEFVEKYFSLVQHVYDAATSMYRRGGPIRALGDVPGVSNVVHGGCEESVSARKWALLGCTLS